VFEHADIAYQRFVPDTYVTGPYVRRLGVPDVMVLDIATGEELNLSIAEENAFWAWAVIETLRHTGVFSGVALAPALLACVFPQLRG
jgi:hypothetical protein